MKATESALLTYIRNAKVLSVAAANTPECRKEPDHATENDARNNKRRIHQDNEIAAKRQKSKHSVCLPNKGDTDGSTDKEEDGVELEIDNSDTGGTDMGDEEEDGVGPQIDDADNGSTDMSDDEGDGVESEIDGADNGNTDMKKDKDAIRILTKKVRDGLKRVRERKETKYYAEKINTKNFDAGESARLRGSLSEFYTQLASSGDIIQDRLLCLSTVLWQESLAIVKGAKEKAWKYKFLASCLRNIRGSLQQDGECLETIYRWKCAATMVNAIVNGLWEKWGCRAALVYEALAGKVKSLPKM